METTTTDTTEAPYSLANSVKMVASPHDLWLRFGMEQPTDAVDGSAFVEVARIVMPIRMLQPLIEKLQGLAAEERRTGHAG